MGLESKFPASVILCWQCCYSEILSEVILSNSFLLVLLWSWLNVGILFFLKYSSILVEHVAICLFFSFVTIVLISFSARLFILLAILLVHLRLRLLGSFSPTCLGCLAPLANPVLLLMSAHHFTSS